MSIQKSIYEKLILESSDGSRSIDISKGAISIDYYEDIFSPTITAKIKIVNTGNTITAEKGNSKQSIYNGLPLRGGERVSLKIAGNSSKNPGLDFSKRPENYFYVSKISDVITETNQESFTLHLVSREALTNETARVGKKFSRSLKISDSVNQILKDILKTNNFKSENIEPTSNEYGFIGNMRKPFTVLVWLASKAVSGSSKDADASAGYFFFQNQNKFQFQSTDALIKKPIRKTKNGQEVVYTYNQVNLPYDENNKKTDNYFNNLNYFVDTDQALVEKLRLGTYSSYRIYYNPLTFEIKPQEFKGENYSGSKTASLGRPLGEGKNFLPDLSKGGSSPSNKKLQDSPTRIITAVLDLGTLDPEASQKLNADPGKNQSQSLMRYNVLFTQTLNVIVPSNTNLRAGDVIKCNFPKVTQSTAKEYDPETSGLYIIKELCHHFDSRASYTSMKLVRDTFGPRKN